MSYASARAWTAGSPGDAVTVMPLRRDDTCQQARIGADEMADALAEVAGLLPEAKVLATTLRDVPSAGVNDWSSAGWSAETGFVTDPMLSGLLVLDRVGSGDGFAAGPIHGVLSDAGLERALAYGTAHGALTWGLQPGRRSAPSRTRWSAPAWTGGHRLHQSALDDVTRDCSPATGPPRA